MAKEEIALSLSVDANAANQSVGSFKNQLKDATQQLTLLTDKFGETSNEVETARKGIENLNNSITEANALSKSFSAAEKFEKVGGAVEGVVKGFEAFQGAVMLAGIESEAVEKVMQRVQGLMQFSEGIKGVLNAVGSFKALGASIMKVTVVTKIAKTVQNLWNAAMAANPIGLLVTAIAAVIAGITALVKWFKVSADESESYAQAIADANEQLKNHKKLLDESSSALEADSNFLIERAKAQGKSTAEIRKLIIAEQDKKIAIFEAAKVTEEAIVTQNEYTLSTLKAADADEELIKSAEETLNKTKEQLESTKENIKKGYEDRLKLQRGFIIEDDKLATDARNKAEEKAKEQKNKAIEKAKEEAKARLEANKEQNKKQEELQQDLYLKNLANEDERAREKLRLDFENKKKEIEQTKASEIEKEESIKLLREQYFTDRFNLINEQEKKLKEEEDKKAEEKKKAEEEKIQKEIDAFNKINQIRIDAIKNQFVKEQELEAVNFKDKIDQVNDLFNQGLITEAQRYASIENARKIHEENLLKIQKDAKEAEEKLDDEKYAKKREQIKQVSDTIGALSEAVGKETAAGKALAIAQALINTYQGASEAIKEKSILPQPFSTIQKIASVAAILATGFKTVKSIAGVKVPGGGGGGSVPSAPSIAQAAPILPQAQTTRIDQGQINQIGNAAVRSYVLETDVANNQERRIRIERAARIG